MPVNSSATDGNAADVGAISALPPGSTRPPSTGSVERWAYKWVDGRLKVDDRGDALPARSNP